LLITDLKSQLMMVAGTFVLCELLRLLFGKFFHHSHNNQHWVHTSKTPRVGGIAIFIASFVTLLPQIIMNGIESSVLVFIFFIIPIFCLGMLEDWLGDIRAKTRLMLTSVMVILASVAFLDLDVEKGGTLTLLLLVIFSGAGIGLIHGSNLIDGLNGLSATWAIAALIIFGGMLADIPVLNTSQSLGVAGTATVFTSCFLGFLISNFPAGRVFLGDAGAYLAGGVVFFVAALIVLNTSDYRVWSQVVAIVSFPILELTWTFVRRYCDDKTKVFQPDKKHLHTMVNHSLAIIFPLWTTKTTNNIASIALVGTVVQSTWWAAVLMPHSLWGCAVTLLFIPTIYFCATLLVHVILKRETR
jgi:UDP-N-acetylmuramyl pentapeptide phosphotransferase/UDP-N-acetylglucosamine-1-phosphate transferase